MLAAAIVVIVNVVLNRRNKDFPVCKCVPIVTFSFEDAPEAFHRASGIPKDDWEYYVGGY